jgi:alkylation response protein AidB-like acyl-CoA dehydrogenase
MSDTLVYDAALRLFGDLSTGAVVDAAEAGEWPARLWQAVEEAGFLDVLATASGSADLSTMPTAVAVWRAAGHHAAPLPLAETALARWLIAAAGGEAPTGALAVAPVARGDWLDFERDGDVVRVWGALSGVPWGASSARVVAFAGGSLVAIDPRRMSVATGSNLAGEPRDTIAVDATLPAVEAMPLPAVVDGDLLLRLGALARSAQMVGAMEAALALALRYANDRVQFGRPIAKFQAIQHQLALCAEQVAAAGVALEAAADAVGAASASAEFAVAAAKIRVGEAAGKAAEITHQVHGAIGFTHEYPLHRLTRRLWSWRDEFGTESDWSIALGRRIAAAGADALWPTITAG